MKKNTNLNNAIAARDDEFYTLKEDAEMLINTYQEQIINPEFVIWCPFDTEESEIVKVLKLRVKCYYSHIERNNDFFKCYESFKNYCVEHHKKLLIISNPPFSKLRQIMELIAPDLNNTTYFIFIAPLLSLTYKNIWFLVKNKKIYPSGIEVKRFWNKDKIKLVNASFISSFLTDIPYAPDHNFNKALNNGVLKVKYNGEIVYNFDSYAFTDFNFKYAAVPVNYINHQRKGWRIIGLLHDPYIVNINNPNGKRIFKRYLIEKIS